MPYSSMAQVPPQMKMLGDHMMSLSEVNMVAAMAEAIKKKKGDKVNPYAVAKAYYKKNGFKKKKTLSTFQQAAKKLMEAKK